MTNNGNYFFISNVKAKLGKLGVEEIVEEAITTVKKITHRDLSKWVS
jgi:hypothetical protein